MPTPAQRRQLMEFSKALTSASTASFTDDKRKTAAVALLFAAVPSDKSAGKQADLRAEAWQLALSRRAALEVELAVEMWLVGECVMEGENRRFAPAPQDVLRLADIARQRIEDVQELAERVLKAEVSQEAS
jgi:hypothetical protein